jgi:hypothetical protein
MICDTVALSVRIFRFPFHQHLLTHHCYHQIKNLSDTMLDVTIILGAIVLSLSLLPLQQTKLYTSSFVYVPATKLGVDRA